MRNLLSFVLGVISRLFYLLLRLILLLDRTICRVYDLPVWSRFAGVLRQAGRRRSVCALSVFGLLFLLPALLLTRPGTLLLADGQPLGVIEDSATLLNAVNAVESSASAVSGTDYYLPLRLQARPVRTAAPLPTQEELERNLITASGELDTLEMIANQDIKEKAMQKFFYPVRAELRMQKASNKREYQKRLRKINAQVDSMIRATPGHLLFTKEQRKAYTTEGGCHHLDGNYTVYGELIEGFDVLDIIAGQPRDEYDRPKKDIRIIQLTIEN